MVDAVRSKKKEDKEAGAEQHYADRLMVDDDGAAWLLSISVRSLWRGVSSGCIIRRRR